MYVCIFVRQSTFYSWLPNGGVTNLVKPAASMQTFNGWERRIQILLFASDWIDHNYQYFRVFQKLDLLTYAWQCRGPLDHNSSSLLHYSLRNPWRDFSLSFYWKKSRHLYNLKCKLVELGQITEYCFSFISHMLLISCISHNTGASSIDIQNRTQKKNL